MIHRVLTKTILIFFVPCLSAQMTNKQEVEGASYGGRAKQARFGQVLLSGKKKGGGFSFLFQAPFFPDTRTKSALLFSE